MDGSPQRGLLHATTLWHFDAAEWAPSTASLADIRSQRTQRRQRLGSVNGCVALYAEESTPGQRSISSNSQASRSLATVSHSRAIASSACLNSRLRICAASARHCSAYSLYLAMSSIWWFRQVQIRFEFGHGHTVDCGWISQAALR